MALTSNNHGGARPGAGRRRSDSNLVQSVTVRISPEAYQMLNELTGNKSAYIDALIRAAHSNR